MASFYNKKITQTSLNGSVDDSEIRHSPVFLEWDKDSSTFFVVGKLFWCWICVGILYYHLRSLILKCHDFSQI